MSLTKWFRKNNKKVFGVVTVIILFGFIGGGALMRNSNKNRIVAEATYGSGREITNLDLHNARQELEMLTYLGGVNVLQSQGLGGILLCELIFTEGRPNPNVVTYLERLVNANQINLSNEDLVSFYDRSWPPAFYWILLRQEARQAGITVANDTIKQILGQVIPSMTNNQGTYGAAMAQAISRYGMPEDKILTIYGQMLSVLEYAQTLCSMQNATSTELQQVASRNQESVNAEWVEFDSDLFAKLLDPNDTPSDEEIQTQFEQFKDVAAGQISESNPFGFGYQFPDRIKLDYIIVELDDVAANLEKPKQEKAELYYKNNAATLFTVREALDPNDPDSGTRDRLQPFSEVAQQIYEDLTAEAAIAKAEQILQEARSLAEAPLMELGSGEERDLDKVRQAAPDYGKLAQELTEKHGIYLVAGSTGLLSRSELQRDGLSRLRAYDRAPQGVDLPDLLFQVEPIGRKTLSLMSVQAPELYDSIGPLKHTRLQEGRQISGQSMALVRLVDVQPAEVPASVTSLYDNTMSSQSQSLSRTNFSVKEQVIQDLQSLAAFKMAEAKAQELSQLAADQGWEAGIAQFNQTYGERLKRSANADPNVMKLTDETELTRASTDRLAFLQQRALGDAILFASYRNRASESLLVDKLYALVAETPEQSLDTQSVIASPGQGKVYVVKHLDLVPLSEESYVETRGSMSTQRDMQQAQRLVALHLTPKNIETRWNLQSTQAVSEETDQTQEASVAP